MDTAEIQIPVPWGFIAGQTWGDPKNQLILMIHGLGDNAASFERLIVYLPKKFYYVSIDLPNHGKSSHYPEYCMIHTLYNILILKLIINYLKREKIIMIGHSWGGQSAILFAQVYPEYVLKLVLLDTFYFYPITVDSFKQHMRERFENIISLNEKLSKGVSPCYTYEEALTKFMDNRAFGSLNKEAAEVLLKRCLIPTEDGLYKFSTNPRLKYIMQIFYGETFKNNFVRKHSVRCPILMIIAKDSTALIELHTVFLKELKRKNKFCQIKVVKGDHNVHNNHPDTVAPFVAHFLTHDAKL